ncbi:MAG: starch-binding outer membrane lipoprotein SusD [Prevotella sp.]|jgi:hypothetical protein|nr:starch-binding outer membrane lipoprotein SusD [Prevotella sp.]MCI1282097.1 starch-binding outer membrane lipoprotein SusD [Prevotella sp.]
MKKIIIKTAVIGLLVAGMTSCTDDLNISSIDPKSSSTYDATELLAKQYATLGLTGQTGPAGNADISGDEGESGFYRTVFNLETLCTDECIWAWQTDTDIPALTTIAWSSSSVRVNWAYQRLAYDVTLYNQFISEQTGKMSDDVIAEVRFLRALHYWYFLDLFHKAPFKDTFNADMPVEKAGKDLYDWIDQELTAIEPTLKAIGSYDNSSNFGRADQGAAYALHARLALNSAVYTDGATKDYQKAKDYCDKIISSGAYALSENEKNGFSGYAQVFMGDNDENPQAMKEIIFAIRQDGSKTEEYAGSTYLVSSMRISGMPYANTDNYWSCNFARKNLVEKFFPTDNIPMAKADDALTKATEAEVIAKDNALGVSTADVIAAAGDDRAMFYTGVGGGIRTLSPGKQITGFLNGASIVKWSNQRLDGASGHNRTFSDTDIPLFRLAEIYLTRAEAEYRLGGQSDAALKDLNVLRTRAHAVAKTSIDNNILIDEWCREFYMEGRRRSDLNRFGLFTGSKYLWDFKGGVAGGSGIDTHFSIYPIPANDISGNPNMTQNPGY